MSYPYSYSSNYTRLDFVDRGLANRGEKAINSFADVLLSLINDLLLVHLLNSWESTIVLPFKYNKYCLDCC